SAEVLQGRCRLSGRALFGSNPGALLLPEFGMKTASSAIFYDSISLDNVDEYELFSLALECKNIVSEVDSSMSKSLVPVGQKTQIDDLTRRRHFIGGSDARIIMGDDEEALLRLWREKRCEVEPKDLSGNLIVQLGVVTEDLNRRWYEANTGQVIADIQR